MLEAGAGVDDEDREGATALHYAARSEVVVALIMAGADVDHEDHAGRTPGRRARERSDMAVVQVLLNNHADPSKIKITDPERKLVIGIVNKEHPHMTVTVADRLHSSHSRLARLR